MTPRQIFIALQGASAAQAAGIVGAGYYHYVLVDIWQENIASRKEEYDDSNM